jgi:hypothetical protein
MVNIMVPPRPLEGFVAFKLTALSSLLVVATLGLLSARAVEPGPAQAFSGRIALTNPRLDTEAEIATARIKFSGTLHTQEESVETDTLITSKLLRQKMTSKDIIAAAAAAVVPPIENLGRLQLLWESSGGVISLRLRRAGQDPVDVEVPTTVMKLILAGDGSEALAQQSGNDRRGFVGRLLTTWRVILFKDLGSTRELDLRGVGPVVESRRGVSGQAKISGFNTGDPVEGPL